VHDGIRQWFDRGALRAAPLLVLFALVAMGCEPTSAPPVPAALDSAARPVVYGEDNRNDIYAEPGGGATIGRQSVVVMVDNDALDTTDPTNIRVLGDPLGQVQGLCDGERFADQPTGGGCSGTLVWDDLVLTAGHCVDAQSCPTKSFVFDYLYTAPGRLETISQDEVFGCGEVVARELTDTGVDYAVVRLSRRVDTRVPASVRQGDTALATGTPVTLIGFPSGIPMKVASGGNVVDPRAGTLDWFGATVDAFGGNSGSGVFDADLSQVGILVRGETDYVFQNGCFVVNQLSETNVAGENVVYVGRAIEGLCRAEPGHPLCVQAGGGYCSVCVADGDCETDFGCATSAVNPQVRSCGRFCMTNADCRTDHVCGRTGVCRPRVADACVGNDVWRVDSCSRPLVVSQACANGSTCQAGQCVVPTAGDVCTAAESLAARSQVLTGTLSADFANDYTGSCAGRGPDRVFRFTVNAPTPFTAIAEGFDTTLYLRQSCEDAATELVCNDDEDPPGNFGSRIAADLAPGEYFLFLDAWGTDVGDYTLTLTFGDFCPAVCTVGQVQCSGSSVQRCAVDAQGCATWQTTQTCQLPQTCVAGACQQPAAGDTCDAPTEIDATDATFVGDLSRYQDDYAGSCGGGGPERVYTFFVAQPSRLLAEAVGGTGPVLFLRSRCRTASFEEACDQAAWPNDPSARLDIELAPGRYFLFVDTDGDVGTYQLGVQLEPICPQDCAAGASRCVTGGVEVCQQDARGCSFWGMTQSCPPGEVCDGDQCAVVCGVACDLGTTQCQGGGESICTRDATGCHLWTPPTPCANGEQCVGDACQLVCTDQCMIGASRCANGTNGGLQQCVASPLGCGVWSAVQACGARQACVGGQCVDICTDRCALGDNRCATNGNGFQACEPGAAGCTVWGATLPCDRTEHCEAGQCLPNCQPQCVPGDSGCAGNASRQCIASPDGCHVWSPLTPCANREVCINGACQGVCVPECNIGDRQCSGTGAAQVCELSPEGCQVWSRPVTCVDGDICQAGQCVASCVAECQPGAAECFGGGVRTCRRRPDGCHVWSSALACDAGQRCASGVCEQVCVPECRTGELSCQGDGVRSCVPRADGCNVWSAATACGAGRTCDNGACVEACVPECTPGAEECVGNGTRSCVARADGCHQWSRVRTCQPDEVCRAGQCELTCQDECRGGERRCAGDGTQSCERTALGCLRWSPLTACLDGERCVAGSCQPLCTDLCERGERRCAGNATQTCAVDAAGCNAWSDVVECGADASCREGWCEPACADTCSLGDRTCDGDGYRDCEVSLSGCRAWSSLRFCGDEAACLGGECVLDCGQECVPGEGVCLDSETRQTCVEDARGCTRWTAPLLCGAGDLCVEGRCAVPDDEPDAGGGPTERPYAGPAGSSQLLGRPAAGCLGCQTSEGRPYGTGLLGLVLLVVWGVRRRVGG